MLVRVLGVIAVAGVLYLVISVLPPALVDDAKLKGNESVVKAENDVRGQLLEALAGLVLLGGLYFTARTLLLNSQTLALTSRGQITERLTKAVDQLGHEQPQVQVGGMYALARIAEESPDDKSAISDILVAYVREPAENRAPRVSAGVQAAMFALTRPGFGPPLEEMIWPEDLGGWASRSYD